MTTTDSLRRRTVLAALSVLGATSVLESTTATATDTEVTDDCAHGKDGRICTLPCDRAERHSPYKDCGATKCKWSDSAITFRSCSECTRHISVSVSKGKISEKREVTRSEYENFDGVYSLHLEPHEHKTLWFTGSLRRLDMEPADINVGISQRSIHQAKSSRCRRRFYQITGE